VFAPYLSEAGRIPRRYVGFLTVAIASFCVVGVTFASAIGEPVVFYCEVEPEQNRTIVAVTRGTVDLRARMTDSAVPVAADTLGMVGASGRVTQVPEIPGRIKAQVAVWEKTLRFGYSLLDTLADSFGATRWFSDVDLGNMTPGQSVQQIVSLPVSAIPDDLLNDFYIEQVLERPTGVSLDSHLERETEHERKLLVPISARIAADAAVENGQEFIGKLILQTSDPSFNREMYTMNVLFRVSLPSDSEESSNILARARKWAPYLVAATAFLVVIGGVYTLCKRASLKPKERMQGKLTMTRDPTHGESGIIEIDLQLASQTLKKQYITFGSGPEADIQLPHHSVEPLHCQIFPAIEKGINKIFIMPLGQSSIRINNRDLTAGAYMLQNETHITLGKFSFDFELTDIYRQLEVWTMKGAVLRGVITYAWDVTVAGFTIVPFVDKFSNVPPPVIDFSFSEVKVIRFYREHGGFDLGLLKFFSRRSEKRALVHFTDGTSLECQVGKGDPKQALQIFALPLAHDNETDFYVIIRKNVREIEFL